MPTVPPVGSRKLVEADWSALRHFSQAETAAACEGGAWQHLDAGTFYLLDGFAGYLVAGQRLIKSAAFSPKRTADGVPTATWNTPETRAHAKDSWHYRGRAYDLLFPRNRLATAWLTAMRFPRWGGIGCYPFWRPDPGLHLDTRWIGDDEQGRGFRVLWWVDRGGRYHYLNDESDIVVFLATLRTAE